jgi:hypothetical protein
MIFGGFGPFPQRLRPEGVSAAQWMRFTADFLAVGRTTPFARVIFYRSSFTGVVTWYRAMSGVALTSDQIPVIEQVSSTFTNVTFPAVLEDEFGVEFPVNIKHATDTIYRVGGTGIPTTVQLIAPNVVRVKAFTAGGSGIDGTNTIHHLTVW